MGKRMMEILMSGRKKEEGQGEDKWIRQEKT